MQGNELHILVLVGTTRPERKSLYAAQFVKEVGQEFEGVKVTLVDPVDLHFPGDGNDENGKDPKYSKLTQEADAFFIVTPEYNHSYPGSLKRMLDSEYENYYRKPVALAGVSSGMIGGARAVQSLLFPLRKMGMVMLVNDVYFPNSYDIFTEDGKLIDEKVDFYTEAIMKTFDELIWMARTLKSGKDNLKENDK
jgi:NAD(P)H-dependent FMN reductase